MIEDIKLTKEAKERINGSGLFFFRSDVPDTLKLKILDWVDSLHPWEKTLLEILIQEGKDNTMFDMQEDI